MLLPSMCGIDIIVNKFNIHVCMSTKLLDTVEPKHPYSEHTVYV